MPTLVNLKKTLHRPQWEQCNILPFSTAAGVFARNLQIPAYNINYNMMVATNAVMYQYDSVTDSACLVAAPTTAFTNALGAGACGRIHPVSKPYPATTGTTSTITTGLTITRDLRGYKIRITQGAQAGQELTILSNTIGANSIITVATQSLAFSSSTLFQLLTPHVYVYDSGATGPGIFQVYSWALNTWTPLNNAAITLATDAVIVSTPSIVGGAFDISGASYTFGNSTNSSLNISGSNWGLNQWINSQIRLTAGTGAGQTRTIVSNTTNLVGISGTWQANPDASTAWQIEGNDDYLYLTGNAGLTMYRYSIQYNFWTTLAPTVARAANTGAGVSLNWPYGVPDAAWTAKNAIKNGRYLYSFRGAGTVDLSIYDIPANTWINTQPYGNAAELFTTGSSFEYDGGNYIYTSIVGAPGMRIQRFNLTTMALEPTSLLAYPQGAATVGDKLFAVPYNDGSTNLVFLYNIQNTSNVMFRQLISPFVS